MVFASVNQMQRYEWNMDVLGAENIFHNTETFSIQTKIAPYPNHVM